MQGMVCIMYILYVADIDAGDSVYYFLDGSKSVQGSKPTSPQTPGPNVNDIYELDGDG